MKNLTKAALALLGIGLVTVGGVALVKHNKVDEIDDIVDLTEEIVEDSLSDEQ